MTLPTLEHFEASQPIAARFLRQALESHSLAHGYIFKGQALNEMYNIALALAKALNCREKAHPAQPCGACPNCLWVDANSHPAVMTISRHTFLVQDTAPFDFMTEEALNKKGDKAQSQIKAGQISRLLYQLSLSSEHCRVVLFIDAEITSQALPSQVIPPYDWRNITANGDKAFHIRPLNRHLFNDTSANRFLKTLEEPLPNTIFLFLTDNEANLMETIVSRCQVLTFAPGPVREGIPVSEAQAAYFQRLLTAPDRDPYTEAARFLETLVEGGGFTVPQAVAALQAQARRQFIGGGGQDFPRYRQLQTLLEDTGRMLRDNTNPEQTLNHLFRSLSQQSA